MSDASSSVKKKIRKNYTNYKLVLRKYGNLCETTKKVAKNRKPYFTSSMKIYLYPSSFKVDSYIGHNLYIYKQYKSYAVFDQNKSVYF